MGTIVVGLNKPKTLNMGGFTIAPEVGSNQSEQVAETKEQPKVDVRENRLKEIFALPVEEQLPLLLEEGFTEEAKKLSEQLAKEQPEHEEGTDDEKQGVEDPTDDTTDDLTGESTETATSTVEPEKKKVGRPKKSEE